MIIRTIIRNLLPRVFLPGFYKLEVRRLLLLFYYGYVKNKITSKKINVNWKHIHLNRIALINAFVNKTLQRKGVCNYLEIGCGSNSNFNSIPLQNEYKVGVDPDTSRNGGKILKQTSDEFFSQNKRVFDVIFIDGLHEYEQCQKDAINSLKFLDNGGTILFHDLIPLDWKTENVPRINQNWTGDVWKVALELSNSSGLNFSIANCDSGVGILSKSNSDYIYNKMNHQIKDYNFKNFLKHREKLPIEDPFQILKKIK